MKRKSTSRETLGLSTHVCILRQCLTGSGTSAIHQHLFAHPFGEKNRKRNHSSNLYLLILCLLSVYYFSNNDKENEHFHAQDFFFKGMPSKNRHSFPDSTFKNNLMMKEKQIVKSSSTNA